MLRLPWSSSSWKLSSIFAAIFVIKCSKSWDIHIMHNNNYNNSSHNNFRILVHHQLQFPIRSQRLRGSKSLHKNLRRISVRRFWRILRWWFRLLNLRMKILHLWWVFYTPATGFTGAERIMSRPDHSVTPSLCHSVSKNCVPFLGSHCPILTKIGKWLRLSSNKKDQVSFWT